MDHHVMMLGHLSQPCDLLVLGLDEKDWSREKDVMVRHSDSYAHLIAANCTSANKVLHCTAMPMCCVYVSTSADALLYLVTCRLHRSFAAPDRC
jgi:hypothetical protein